MNVLGDDGFYYRYFHLHENTINVSQNLAYPRGRRIGKLGETSDCPAVHGYDGAAHLHFDRWDAFEDDNVLDHAADPWLSLRAAYARFALKADGVTLDSAINAASLRALAAYGGGTGAYLAYGYPYNPAGNATANVQTGSSVWGTAGARQYIGNGYDTYGTNFRNGALTKMTGQTYGAWMPAEMLDVWIDWGEQNGFLGWPTQDPVMFGVPIQQDFEGGCINWESNNGTYVGYSYLNPNHPCNNF